MGDDLRSGPLRRPTPLGPTCHTAFVLKFAADGCALWSSYIVRLVLMHVRGKSGKAQRTTHPAGRRNILTAMNIESALLSSSRSFSRGRRTHRGVVRGCQASAVLGPASPRVPLHVVSHVQLACRLPGLTLTWPPYRCPSTRRPSGNSFND